MATAVQKSYSILFPFTQKYHDASREPGHAELSQALSQSCSDNANNASGFGFDTLVNISGLVEQMYQSSTSKTKIPRFVVDSILLNQTHRTLFQHICDTRFDPGSNRECELQTDYFTVNIVNQVDLNEASKFAKNSEIWFLDHVGNWLSRKPLISHPLCNISRLMESGLQLVHIRHLDTSLVWVFEQRNGQVGQSRYQKFIDYLLFSRGQVEPCFLPRPIHCSRFTMPANQVVKLNSTTVSMLAHQPVEPLLSEQQVARNIRQLARKAHVSKNLNEYLENAVKIPIDRYSDWGRYLACLDLENAEISISRLAQTINSTFDRFRLLDYRRLMSIYYLQYVLNLSDSTHKVTVLDLTPRDGHRELCESLNCQYRVNRNKRSSIYQIILLNPERGNQVDLKEVTRAWESLLPEGFLLLSGNQKFTEQYVIYFENQADVVYHEYLLAEQSEQDYVTDRYYIFQRGRGHAFAKGPKLRFSRSA